MPDPLSLADRLAPQRTRLANERTFLTYVRTSLAMVGFGLVLPRYSLKGLMSLLTRLSGASDYREGTC